VGACRSRFYAFFFNGQFSTQRFPYRATISRFDGKSFFADDPFEKTPPILPVYLFLIAPPSSECVPFPPTTKAHPARRIFPIGAFLPRKALHFILLAGRPASFFLTGSYCVYVRFFLKSTCAETLFPVERTSLFLHLSPFFFSPYGRPSPFPPEQKSIPPSNQCLFFSSMRTLLILRTFMGTIRFFPPPLSVRVSSLFLSD